jgi:hypothetical protein
LGATRPADVLRWRPLDVHAVNDNDVRAFVHRWYAAFERLEPAEFFLEHMYSGAVFGASRTSDEFRAWYADWQSHCPWDHHEVLDLAVAGGADAGWRVDVLLRLVGEWHDDDPAGPMLMDRYIRQTWSLRHDGADFRLGRCDVRVVRDMSLR